MLIISNIIQHCSVTLLTMKTKSLALVHIKRSKYVTDIKHLS